MFYAKKTKDTVVIVCGLQYQAWCCINIYSIYVTNIDLGGRGRQKVERHFFMIIFRRSCTSSSCNNITYIDNGEGVKKNRSNFYQNFRQSCTSVLE